MILMYVLNLSLDKKILETESPVQQRLVSLAEKTGEITVIVPRNENREKDISPHLRVYSVGGGKLLQFLNMWRRAERVLREKNYNLITVQDAYYLGLLGCIISKRFNIPLEIQVHGLEQFSGFRKWIAGFVLRRADTIRVVSERLRRELATRYTLHATRFYTLPVYTQVDTSPKRSTNRKAIPYPFTFLTVGRLVSVKNISLQIKAFAKLAEKVPHTRLRIVGSGPERANLEREARSLKLEASVRFEGEHTDMSRFYEEADAVLLTSDSEGWGRTVLEAAAYHVPSIMTNVGLAQEVIKNKESGFIIPVGDEKQLILAMKELIDNPALRERLGQGAYEAFRALPNREDQIRKQVEQWASFK